MNQTNRIFRSWRSRMNMTQEEASKALKLGYNTVANYDRGKRYDVVTDVEVPHVVLLACACLERGLPPIS